MTNKLQNLFPSKGTYAGSTVKNHAGAPAFNRSLEEQTIQVLMTGNLESTYYCSADTLAKEAVDILTAASNKDPEFLAKAIVYARNEGYLRVAPIVGLIVLSVNRPDLFRKIFGRVILQPGDLQDFVSLVRSKSVRSMGRAVRETIGDWMNTISPYHVVKYGAPQKKPGAGSPVNLRDVLRLSHPRPTEGMEHVFKYIVLRIRGEEIPKELLGLLPEQIRAYEHFKDITSTPEKAKANEAEAIGLIEIYDLPYEVVTARLSTPSAWKAMARKAPFMNMLRNLNNYEKNGVFKDKELKALVIKRLTDKEQIAKSKQFPFRFLAAYNVFKGDQEVRDALVTAVELSVMNIPDMGRTLVAPDESGSMASPVSERSDITMKQVGNLFAAALYKKSAGGFMVPFESRAHPVGFGGPRVNKGDSIVTIAETLGQIGGGTDLSAPVMWAMDREFDTGVFITDSESWVDLLYGTGWNMRYQGQGVLDRIRQFRRKNPKAQFFFIQIVPNNAVQVPQGEPGVHFIYGWSDNVLKYISSVLAGGQGQVAAVKATSLEAPKPAKVVPAPRKVVRPAVKPSKANKAKAKPSKAKKR